MSEKQQPDPATQLFVWLILGSFAVAAIIFLGVLASPFIVAYGGYRIYKWHTSKPPPPILTTTLHEGTNSLVASVEVLTPQEAITSIWQDLVPQIRKLGGGRAPAKRLFLTVENIIYSLYETEFDFTVPIKPQLPESSIEMARYRDKLLSLQRRAVEYETHWKIAKRVLSDFVMACMNAAPPHAFDDYERADKDDYSLSVPFYQTVKDLPRFVETIASCVYDDDTKEAGLFASIREQIDHNITLQKDVLPTASKLPVHELPHAYLHSTPLYDLFSLAVTIPFPLTSYKKAHWSIFGRIGSGKSQLIQSVVLEHLKEPDPPGMMIIDNQGDMLRKIERLEVFQTTLKDRLTVVDVQSITPPALNMFDLPKTERNAIDVIDLYAYIFSTIDADLTSRQSTTFSFLIRLVLAREGATILTLLELLDERPRSPKDSKFWPLIEQMDTVARSYFENRFFTNANNQTKEQLSTRLYGVLRVEQIMHMFTAKENKLDIKECIDKKHVVLVDTRGLGEASSIFGRYMIALALRAAFQRDTKDPDPFLLFVDEAFDLLDSSTNRILIQARKFGLFMRFATQQYDQIPLEIRAATATNTEVKLTAGLSAHDARTLAQDMRTTPDFLLETRKFENPTVFQWACFVQNVTETAIRFSIPYGALENAPKADNEAFYPQFKARRERLAATRDTAAKQRTTSIPTHSEPKPEDKGDKWM